MKTSTDYDTYEEYCKVRSAQGYQVIPESLFNALVEDEKMYKLRKEEL